MTVYSKKETLTSTENKLVVTSGERKERRSKIGCEIKRILEGTNSRITEAKERISEVEDRVVEINEAERKKGKIIKIN